MSGLSFNSSPSPIQPRSGYTSFLPPTVPPSQDARFAYSDEQELKSARLRGVAWSGILAFLPTMPIYTLLARALFIKPEGYVNKRADVLSGQRSQQDALKHENNVKHAQLMAQLPSAIAALPIATAILVAQFAPNAFRASGEARHMKAGLIKLAQALPFIVTAVQAVGIALLDNPEKEVAKKQTKSVMQ